MFRTKQEYKYYTHSHTQKYIRTRENMHTRTLARPHTMQTWKMHSTQACMFEPINREIARQRGGRQRQGQRTRDTDTEAIQQYTRLCLHTCLYTHTLYGSPHLEQLVFGI